MRGRLPFLRADPLRAALEAFILGAILWFCVLAFQPSFALFVWQHSIDSFVGPLCILWYVLRLRIPTDFLRRQSFVDVAIAVILSFALSGIELVFTLVLLRNGVPTNSSSRAFQLIVLGLLLNFTVFVVFRLCARFVVFWDRLRRTQLRWSLTHAHVMVVALGAGLIIVLLEVLATISLRDFSLVVPTTLGLVLFGGIALLAVVPPSALFSYLVIRRTTRRLELLATATSALRGGNYAVRVPVTGEDEVAQLQANFNAMAADLERAVHALRGERDTVAGLLQSRRELIANVSHELRTPMATLRSYLETSLTHWDEHPSPTLHRDLQIMENEVIRLQGLVEDLFTLSRAEVGKLTLRCAATDVGQLVQRIVAAGAPLVWRTSRIEMAADVPCELPPVLVDASRLEQVLWNLLHNAARHTSPGGIIVVVVSSEPEAVVIHVKDTGEGIAPADLPHIWERFYQAESARASTGGGTGLGLSLVKELIEAMNGTVGVESVPGEGSCFTLRLPLATPALCSKNGRVP